jgi:phosphoribosylanthranilate isomerase
LNFFPDSPRCVTLEVARRIVEAVAERVLTVGVFVNAGLERIAEVKGATGIACVQLHGDETPEQLARLLPHAYKALRVRGPESIAEAGRYAGEYLLLDAFVPDQAGGTGQRFDWALAQELARTRKLALAGGLTPGNVAEAIVAVRPYCVDVASGVERSPTQKDPAKVRAFIQAAKRVAPS